MSLSRPRRVLLIAFHYPPCATSSGLQRSLSFSVHLRDHGWSPLVLSASPSAHERTSERQLADIPADVPVARAFCLDTARHLAIRGRYWSRLAIPDRWISWWPSAVALGLRLIRRHAIQAIWSTYPIATAHNIAATLVRLTGLPWIADFRDPLVEYIAETNELFPKDPVLRGARLDVEARAIQRCSHAVFCTESARRIVLERYPQTRAQQLSVIPNGYNEAAFRDAERLQATARSPRRVLLHSGTIYPGADRDPTALFRALTTLRAAGLVARDNFELRLRDPSNEQYFARLAADCGIEELVSILPPLPYRDALAEMLEATGLLLLQGYTSNPAVPAKLYEYLRARQPIVGLVHPAGETAATLRQLNIDTVASLTDADEIAQLLSRWLRELPRLRDQLPPQLVVETYSREKQAGRLAALLETVCKERRRVASD